MRNGKVYFYGETIPSVYFCRIKLPIINKLDRPVSYIYDEKNFTSKSVDAFVLINASNTQLD